MKATELMAGDFVIVKDYGIREIIGIRDFDGVVEISENEDSEIEIPYDNISPIPLTPEILEKNGWKRDPDKEWKYNNSHILPRYCYQWEMRSVKIEMDEGREGFTTSLIIGRRFYAVHELQHALRLCGLDELANNFKVD